MRSISVQWSTISECSAFSGQLLSRTVFILICALCVLCGETFSQGLPIAPAQAVGMNAAKLNLIDALVNADIAVKKLPGAVVIVGHKGRIVYRKAFGNRSLVPTVEPMTVDTIFDVASLTKPIATATSIMILVEQGKLRLNDTVGKFIPEIEDEQAKRITIQQLLTHTSGYAPDFDLKEKWVGRDGMFSALKKEKLRNPPGTRFVYSDIGFIVLGEIIERVAKTTLDVFVKMQHLATLSETSFIRSDLNRNIANSLASKVHLLERIAPTENVCGQQSYLGSEPDIDCGQLLVIMRGTVHDPTAYRMQGVAGHAGLFSTADDLARYCQMILNWGVAPNAELDPKTKIQNRKSKNPHANAGGTDKMGVRILSAQTVARMTSPYVVSEDGNTRGLGWDINTAFSSNRGELFPLGSFGHTGFTGTSIWIDPTSQTFVVFMSNRVHPDGKGDITPLRARVATVVASAIEDTTIEKWREAEARYFAAVAAQIPRFKEAVQRSAINGQQSEPPASAGGRKPAINASVLNGIDILERNGFKELAGLKIGLVSNQTGRNLAGKLTIDILNEARNVNLVALFSPEHGIRGQADEKVSDSVDEKTGLPIYSLYSETRRPKPEQLKGLDAIVYDIQDVGARFYTYTVTLRNVMEEAARAGIPVYILDRPNPINGDDIEGPFADEDRLSFTAAHTIPIRYGMTIGELGLMMNAERKIGAEVRVIKMEGWRRSMWFDETGQTWVNPSPNMRSLTEATLYPGIGLLETTNLSVGRGTDTPFEVVGAPWFDGQKIADYLNKQNLPGVRFVPIRSKPNASVFKHEELGGVNIIITDRRIFRSVHTGFAIAAALRKLYPNEWEIDRYERLMANTAIFARIRGGDSAETVVSALNFDIEEFGKRRAPYLLYK